MTTINPGGNLNVGLNGGITKRVGGGGEAGQNAKAGGAGSFANDALVRSAATAASGPIGGALAATAIERLASAYDPNPAVFARNLAEQSLNEVASLVG